MKNHHHLTAVLQVIITHSHCVTKPPCIWVVRAPGFYAAVFTYGDRGTTVVGIFAAFAAAVHIAELNRNKK